MQADLPPLSSLAVANSLDVGQCATLACLLDVSTPKPGNVHRGADFADVTFLDFAVSAVAIAPAMTRAHHQPLGDTVLQAVQATRSVVSTNTNLGIILLLAPLAACEPALANLSADVAQVLSRLDSSDAEKIYQAIRLANPGGLGGSQEMDVHGAATPDSLMQAMRYASDRDMIARQYAHNFADLQDTICPILAINCRELGLQLGIIDTFLVTMSEFPDSLIQRKLGAAAALDAAKRAENVRSVGTAGSLEYYQALADFDFWLRSDGHRRNPGTTADLITAAIYVGLRQAWLRIRDV